jgi:hypothetical protein
MNLQSLIQLFANRKLDGRVNFRGLKISIENKKGSIRQGIDKDGKPWKTRMTWPYGYARLTEGVDNGDHLDVFIGPNENAKMVYIIHVKDITNGKFDEDKCFLGFNSAIDAKKAFLENYNNPEFYGGMDSLPFEKFKEKALATRGNPKKIVAATTV